jgi:hypothetical protein
MTVHPAIPKHPLDKCAKKNKTLRRWLGTLHRREIITGW